MPKVFVSRRLAQQAIDMLSQYAEVDVWKGEDAPPRDEFLRRIADVDGIVLWGEDKIDGAAMDAAPKLKLIANVSVGYDNIDIEAAAKRGIMASNTPGVVTESTADLTMALMLAIARRLVEMASLPAKGEWKLWGPMDMLGHDVHHKTLGIIGMGRIGSAVARRAKGFSMRVIYHNRHRHPDEAELGVEYVADIPTLLREADFVSIHVPLTAETKHLIGAKELAMMKPTAFLINTARGKVVDQQALYQALKRRQIAGAAIDVTYTEPIPKDDPLLSLDNIIVTPHIGTQTGETGVNMSVLAVENMIAALKGEPVPNCVNCHLLGKE
ncbi:MAG TPA: D-glycerate dehydrogenase [Dehalococcoidia bacterium]|jgi:glyoxylate reductase|nr:D-glycerate dehydrogenase [Dehalococcoidia bacterium]